MSSRYGKGLVVAVLGLCATLTASVVNAGAHELRVCADPADLPYSRADERGFENRIASLLAAELRMPLRYYWLPQRHGFVRKTLGAHLCDVIFGVPVGLDGVLTTRPYYHAGYALIYRADRDAPYTSLDDARLRNRRIGVQLPGNDMATTHPGETLARHGVVDNVIGYTAFEQRPAGARMIDALVNDRLDVALMWEPQAGYFAATAARPLNFVTLHGDATPGATPLAIALGVRRDDQPLRDRLDAALAKLQPQIRAVLAEYGMPREGLEDSTNLADASGPTRSSATLQSMHALSMSAAAAIVK